MLNRLRVDKDGKKTEFTLHNYGTQEAPEFRVELKVHAEEDIQRFYREGILVGVRLFGHPVDRAAQKSSISPRHIEGLGKPLGFYDEERERARAAEIAGED